MLNFRDITSDDIKTIAEFTASCGVQSCDLTLCGIYLWGIYYGYQMCVYKDTLFIKGRDESGRDAFAVPIGKMPAAEAISLIKDYCKSLNIQPRFSFVPAETLPMFGQCIANKLEGWSDYIYDSVSLATLTGKKLHRKKNRFNKFVKTYPNYRFEAITPENISSVREFYSSFLAENPVDESRMAAEERIINRKFDEYELLALDGGAVWVDDRVVAFAFGERVGDTLYVHFEKADRSFDGSYETINCLFVRNFAHDAKYVDREEDMGDESLRKAKQAYDPIRFVDKYEVIML